MNKKELGIYIHIPFCKQKCNYCDFISYTNKCDKIESYMKCLEKEIDCFDFTKYNITPTIRPNIGINIARRYPTIAIILSIVSAIIFPP